MRRYVGKFQERVPAQAKVQTDSPAQLEVILHKGAVHVTQEIVVKRRNLSKGAGLSIDEISQVVSRNASAKGPGTVRVEILIQNALLARHIQAEIHLMPRVDPGPRVLQVVLVAAHAVKGIHRVSEIAADGKTKRIAFRHDGHIDAQRLVARKILAKLNIQSAAETQGCVRQKRRTYCIRIGHVVTLAGPNAVWNIREPILLVDDAGIIQSVVEIAAGQPVFAAELMVDARDVLVIRSEERR